ncbi:MAG: NAD(P)-dependent oxidoreductase [Alphaproteobacteria bacterium]|nr:NAD(P)-dependent oxidoreductase [Alphaproteobacteria bacterium]
MADPLFGFIGLGAMGEPMARNIAEKGHAMIVHDIAGTADRAPEGAEIAQSNGEIARRAKVIALSLPTVDANRAVIEEIVEAGHTGSVIVDTCTIGPEAAAENARVLEAVGIAYIDSPVSGMKSGAEAGTLASMMSGSDSAIERARPLIEGYSRVLYRVGTMPGQGQRMKVVNNALFIAGLVMTSEALSYGEKGGLDLDTMLEVVNASSGQNFSTAQLFPAYVATGKYDDAGAAARIIEKDLGLFVKGSQSDDTVNETIEAAYERLMSFAESGPDRDMAWMYPYIRDEIK